MPTIPTEVLWMVHFLALSFFIGGQAYCLFVTLPASYQFFSVNEQIRFLQNMLTRQSLALFVALCVAAVSGGLMITPIKGQLGRDYFSVFSGPLAVKLGLFLVDFFFFAYQMMALGFRIRQLDPAGMENDLRAKLNGVRLGIALSSIAILIITLGIVWIARSL